MDNFIALDAFARRQFQPGNESGCIDYPEEAFIAKVRELIAEKRAKGETILVDGYAPFCKHIFVENFTTSVSTSIPITEENKGLIETAYVARTDKELPVLSRFIPRSKLTSVPPAKYLDLILYSREQINIENANMGNTCNDTEEWGLISIKAQDVPFESPMQPITMMRNALGTEHGGSGIPLDQEKYKESVKYWDNHISLV